MVKVLKGGDRSDWERFKVPRSVQQSIPIGSIYREGIWRVAGRFSRTWKFEDINYSVASHDDQLDMFMGYSALLNSLPTDAIAKLSISNRRINPVDFQSRVLLAPQEDAMDKYRAEYNRILTERAEASNNLVQDKYLTISTAKRNIEEARTFFTRVEADLYRSFSKLSSRATALDNHDRLRILHSFFRPGQEQYYSFDLSRTLRRGHDFRDYICPDSLRFRRNYFEVGDRVGRVLFLREYASYIRDNLAALLISGVLYVRASDPAQSEAASENWTDTKDVEVVVDALDSMGYKKVSSEVLHPPMVVCNNEGDKIFIWSYTCDNPERNKGGTPDLVCDEVFNPETAETSREIQVGNVSGTLYEKEERAYLIWSPVGDLRSVTLVIDYPPDAVTEEDLIKMAISCRPDAA